FCPPSIVYHLGGGSLPSNSTRKLFYNYRNSLIMLMKNYPLSSLLFKFPVRMLLDGIAALKSLLSGHSSECTAIIKAYCRFLPMISKTIKKRTQIQKEAK